MSEMPKAMKTFITDMGMEYMNSILNDLCKFLKIENITSTAHHHQTVGTIERSHRTFNEYIRSYISVDKTDWDVWLQYFFFCFNTTPLMAHDYCPYEQVFSKTNNLPKQFNSIEKIEPIYNIDDYAKESKLSLEVAYKRAYNRHPKKQELGITPTPSYAGEMLHIDIYSTDKRFFLTCIDKFSKFAVVQPLLSRAIVDVRSPILQLINFFPNIKTIYCDNEASFNSETITSLLKNQYDIDIVNAPPLHSSSNGQVERFHSTLTEIARCMKIDQKVDDTVELIMRATVEYNKTIHSVTRLSPKQALHSANAEQKLAIIGNIEKAQQANLDRINPTRQNRIFEVGEKVYLKNNKRLGNKLTALYTEERVQADMGTSVLIRGRVVHKDNLR